MTSFIRTALVVTRFIRISPVINHSIPTITLVRCMSGKGSSLLDKLSARGPIETPEVTKVEGGEALDESEPTVVEEEEDEMEDMFVETSKGLEWGGPMRGGRYSEPTRFGDWEQKGRCTDF